MSDFNAQVIEEFWANEGRVGGPFEGAPMILVHHVGARTGTERVVPLRYFPRDDGTMIIVASKAGAPDNPDWFHNVRANPHLQVEVGTETFAVDAEVLDPRERDDIWPELVAAAPGFGAYKEKTDRVIPVVRLRRVS